VLELEIYRTFRPVVNYKLHRDTPRTVVVDREDQAGINSFVLRSELGAKLTVPIGGLGRPRREREVDLQVRGGNRGSGGGVARDAHPALCVLVRVDVSVRSCGLAPRR